MKKKNKQPKKQKTEHRDHIEQNDARDRRLGTFLTALALVAVIGAIVLPLWGTAFTCDDDMFTATARFRHNGYFKSSLAMAQSQGRFYQLFAYPLAQLPYYLGSIEVANLFRLAGTASVFVAFFFMLARSLQSRELAVFITVLSAGLLQTAEMYNPFHALPLWFNLCMTTFFLSAILFHKSIATASPRLRWYSAAVFFVCLLFYEAAIFYLFYYVIIAGIEHRKELNRSIRAWAASIVRIVLPYAVVTAVYLVLYVSFRLAYPPGYTGHEVSPAAAGDIVSTIVLFSLSGLDLNGFSSMDLSWDAHAFIAAMTVLATSFLVLRKNQSKLSSAVLAAAGLIAILFIFAPNILFGFLPKYRQWVKATPYYLGSYNSAFAMAALFGVISIGLVKAANRYKMRTAAALLLSLVLAHGSYQTVLKARPFYLQHKANRQAWTAVDGLIASAESNGLDRASIIVAPSLQVMPYLNPVMYDYWSYYFSWKLGRSVKVVDRFEGKAKEGEVLWLRAR